MSLPVTHRRAYTLMELLVVISILALLIAMLMPSLRSAKDAARTAMCGSNLRQMSIGVNSYGTTYGYFPIGITNGGGVWIWPAIVRKHIGQGVEVFNCPQASSDAHWVKEYGSGLPASDGYEADEVRLKYGGNSKMSYGYNVWGSHIGRSPNTGLGVYRGHAAYGEQKYNRPAQPSDMVEFADSNYDVDLNWSGFVGLEAERQYPGQLHAGAANIAFVDNHVETLKRIDIGNHWEAEVNKRWNMHNQPMFGGGGSW